jgi:hypothetical protein
VTEGTGHVIDPDGDARRALLEAVAEHGPQALSDATIMDNLCRNQLAALPGESILIVSASRADVPALLRDKIPELGNYGAIQSVAATLARASDLDNAASLWVVREFARALGMIAPGGTQPVPRIVPDGPAAGAGAAASAAGAQPQATPGAAAQPPGPGPGMGPGMGIAAGTGAPPPTRSSSASRVLNRNTVGIAAAIALVAGYLGVAAAAHLSPFPAETVAATSSHSPGAGTSTGAGTGPSTSTSTSPASSPDASPDVSPTSDYQILLSKIPGTVRSQSSCPFAGTQFGATAVSQCARLKGLGATTIMYYLYSSSAALTSGISSLLSSAHFHKTQECTTGGEFTEFLVNCQSDFHNKTPSMTGTIAEFPNTNNQSVIVTSDDQQNVMAVMVGTNARDLLAYWKQMNWIVP